MIRTGYLSAVTHVKLYLSRVENGPDHRDVPAQRLSAPLVCAVDGLRGPLDVVNACRGQNKQVGREERRRSECHSDDQVIN